MAVEVEEQDGKSVCNGLMIGRMEPTKVEGDGAMWEMRELEGK